MTFWKVTWARCVCWFVGFLKPVFILLPNMILVCSLCFYFCIRLNQDADWVIQLTSSVPVPVFHSHRKFLHDEF